MSTAAYAYKGKDARGKNVKGRIDALAPSAAASRLRTMGITPTEIKAAPTGVGLQREINLGFGGRVKLKDLSVMARQMATMSASGLSLLRTLDILASQTENPRLAGAIGTIAREVEQGSSLSDAVAQHPAIFPPLMISLVRAGETGGFLDESLLAIAKNFEAEVKLRQTIVSAMTYPLVVLAMAVLAVAGMLLFIVPIFKDMFAGFGSDLPLPTQALVWLSELMPIATPILLVLLLGFALWWSKNKNTDAVRSVIDPIKIKMPIFGSLFAKVAIARFSRNFSSMIGAGVPILQALAVVGDTSGNWVIARASERIGDSVRQGRSIAEPLSNEQVFPPMVTQMIAVGEDSGALELMLEKVADFYDDEVQAAAEQLTAMIEPLMIAVLGVIIGGMIVALYLPIFTVFDQIQ